MTTPAFNPSPSQLQSLLADIATAHLSLTDLAQRYSTTPESLLAFLSTDHARLDIAETELSLSLLVRAAALHHLPKALSILSTILDDHRRDHPHITDPDQRAHSNSNARRAAQAIHRIAHYTVRPIAGLRPPAHSPGPLSAHSPGPPGESRSSAVRASRPTSSPSLAQPVAPAPAPSLARPTPSPALPHSPLPTPHSPFRPSSIPPTSLLPPISRPSRPTLRTPSHLLATAGSAHPPNST